MPALFAGMLLSIAGSIVYKILAGLGIGLATYTVSAALKPHLVSLIAKYVGRFDSVTLQLFGYLQLDIAMVTLITAFISAKTLNKTISMVSTK